MTTPLVSVVVPVFRELETTLGRALESVCRGGADVEPIVVTALEEAEAYAGVRAAFPVVRWLAAPRGRARQMNAGARAARGRWLLFLHADTRLGEGWLDVIRGAETDRRVVGGSFRLVLASADPRARIVEAGARLRLGLFGLALGDQAIFARRDVFEAAGGYRDLPLMEDADLVRRLRRDGRLRHAPVAATTSARRWERDGWVRRSLWNVALTALFALGVDARLLARRYHGRRRTAIAVMTRAPWASGKSRLLAALPDVAPGALREALLLDTLDAVTEAGAEADCLLAVDPPAAACRVHRLAPAAVDAIAQRGGDLGARMAAVFEDLFVLGYAAAVVIGSDLPSVPRAALRRAVALLGGGANRVVLGPAADGGYYLIGARRVWPELFEGIAWGGTRVLEQTLAAAERAGARVALVEPWYDVDTVDDLRRLAGEPPEIARRTRAVTAAYAG
ncbi:MAG TPA: TIGR04283 family arsenosugar biosynthesis glycosyltransferase [Vicinamibacterales bacterium]|nr:TIGR04283 family arsenosugar biosynthesis glycosyltransferase [Vicinamibacterales bacterium]